MAFRNISSIVFMLFLINLVFGMQIEKKAEEYRSPYKQIYVEQGDDNVNYRDYDDFEGKEKFEKRKYIKEEKEEHLSKIEELYNKLIENISDKKEKLRQYGYDIFKRYKVKQTGALGDNYTLGPEDTILLYLWGDPVDILNLDGFYKLSVDREGKIYIPNLGVFYIWGLKISQVKALLEKEFSKKFKNFKIEVSLGKLREYPVFVSGFVNSPSVVYVNATQTVLDAIALAGGISKSGSLRKIVIRKQDGREIKVDLYNLLQKGKPINISLSEKDFIYVSPIGKTVAIYGAVKRSAIYEIVDGEKYKDVIEYAGGILPSSFKKNIEISRYKDNKLEIISLSANDLIEKTPDNGELVFVKEVYKLYANAVSVKGKIKYPGKYQIEDFPDLRSIINTAGLLPDTNMYYADILRKEGDKYTLIKFSPLKVLSGKQNLKLKPLDIITFFPRSLFNPIEVSGEVENPFVVDFYPNISLLDVLRSAKFTMPIKKLKVEIHREKSKSKNEEKENELIQIVYLYDLLIKGEKEKNIKLLPGDKIIVKRIHPYEKDKTVVILGEVKKPGVYKYISGMKLYDLIIKAGGYTKDAYPKALIFIRKSAKKLQQEQLEATLLTLEEEISQSYQGIEAVGSKEEQALAKLAVEKQKKLLEIIKKKAKIGLGRIALDIPNSLEELKNSPDNIELQDGDYIYIPAKPNYVLVLGSVYNPISLPYRPNKTVGDYLKDVGGLKDTAKTDDLYIIKANGRVISMRNFESEDSLLWQDNKLVFGKDFYSIKLEQGDTIVVPAEVKVPIMWRPLIKDITQIIFQALSTAVLASRL